jgi:hypothetical protein
MNLYSLCLLFYVSCFLLACRSTDYSACTEQSQTELKPVYRETPWKPDRAVQSRGLISAGLMAEGVNYAIQGVQQLIEKSNEKYTEEYLSAVSNLKFYAWNSEKGTLDPGGILLEGLELTRTFTDESGKIKEAFTFHLSLEEAAFDDLMHNGKYYFVLDSANIDFAGVKINRKDWFIPWTWFIKRHPYIDIDVFLDVQVNWIDAQGQIYSSVPYGGFSLSLRDVPVGLDGIEKELFERSLRGKRLNGSGFIPPRSSLFCSDEKGELNPCYGRGDVTFIAKVVESSKESYINTLLNQNASEISEIRIKEADLKKVLKQGVR